MQIRPNGCRMGFFVCHKRTCNNLIPGGRRRTYPVRKVGWYTCDTQTHMETTKKMLRLLSVEPHTHTHTHTYTRYVLLSLFVELIILLWQRCFAHFYQQFINDVKRVALMLTGLRQHGCVRGCCCVRKVSSVASLPPPLAPSPRGPRVAA